MGFVLCKKKVGVFISWLFAVDPLRRPPFLPFSWHAGENFLLPLCNQQLQTSLGVNTGNSQVDPNTPEKKASGVSTWFLFFS